MVFLLLLPKPYKFYAYNHSLNAAIASPLLLAGNLSVNIFPVSSLLAFYRPITTNFFFHFHSSNKIHGLL